MKLFDAFAGIGGFSIGLEKAGFETICFSEIDPFCQKILQKNWPGVPIYGDIREVTYEKLESDGITGIEAFSAGFPCQDISGAGNQAGIGEGTRSGLWSECARLLGELQPGIAIFENVTALLSGGNGEWFQQVLWDISQIGYDAEWHCVPASSSVSAPHHRDRIYIIAYPNSTNLWQQQISQQGIKNKTEPANNGKAESLADTSSIGLQRSSIPEINLQKVRTIIQRGAFARTHSENRRGGGAWGSESRICRVANGVPNRAHRIRSLGNAVCPPVVEAIGQAIMKYKKQEQE